MKRNRLLAATLLSAAIASLAGCGGGSASDAAITDPTGSSPPAPAPSPAPAPAPAPSPAPAPAPAPTAVLTWSAPADSDIVDYRIYYGTASRTYLQARGGGVDVGNARSFTATGLNPGTLYYFAVTAVDAAGNESAFSAEVSKLVQ